MFLFEEEEITRIRLIIRITFNNLSVEQAFLYIFRTNPTFVHSQTCMVSEFYFISLCEPAYLIQSIFGHLYFFQLLLEKFCSPLHHSIIFFTTDKITRMRHRNIRSNVKDVHLFESLFCLYLFAPIIVTPTSFSP